MFGVSQGAKSWSLEIGARCSFTKSEYLRKYIDQSEEITLVWPLRQHQKFRSYGRGAVPLVTCKSTPKFKIWDVTLSGIGI